MHSIHRFIFLLSLYLASSAFELVYSQVQPSSCYEVGELIETIQKFHYKPRAINDDFSHLVFNQIMEDIDPDGLILHEEDYAVLKAMENEIDDQISNNQCAFVNELEKRYKQRLEETLELLKLFKNQNFNFKETGFYDPDPEKQFVSKSEWKNRWKAFIKIQTLSVYFGANDSANIIPPVDINLLNKFKNESIEDLTCFIKTRQGSVLEKQFIFTEYLKTIASSFDPHTNYFTLAEEKEFETSLSANTLSFGFEVNRNRKGQLEISSVVPGSPAWKSNNINEGDVLIGMITEEGEKNFACESINEIIESISSEKITDARFKVRKKSGKELQVQLHKERIEVESNIIQSFILKGSKNIGYMYLPSFYTEMTGVSSIPHGCADDIARELIKLKREGIEGLIFDVRDNGGGSVLEAIKLAGSFIDYGTLAITQMGDSEPSTLKDISRGMVFKEPMIILQNTFSGSSSELFAAALQDQNRALLVGAPTYGKSSMQSIHPINHGESPHAFVKITTDAFYRVTGETHQKNGVQPDIFLPDYYDNNQYGEKNYSSVLDFSPINKKTYYYPLPALPVEKLRAKSDGRVKNDSNFIAVKNFKAFYVGTTNQKIPLDYTAFWKHEHDDALSEKFSLTIPLKTHFKAENPSYLSGISDARNSEKELNETLMNKLEHDLNLKETYAIMLDLIELHNK